jgi:hypothetical protein
VTAEPNLMNAHTGHHDPKTAQEWHAVMAANRDVTWTSLLGRIYRTRAHDYRTYSTLYRQALSRIHAETDQALAHAADPQTDPQPGPRSDPRTGPRTERQQALADAVDRAIYTALTYRGPTRPLRAGDDHPDSDLDPTFSGWDLITLTHTGPDGQRRYTPDPALTETERKTQREAAHDATDHPGPTTTDRPDLPGRQSRVPDDAPPPF